MKWTSSHVGEWWSLPTEADVAHAVSVFAIEGIEAVHIMPPTRPTTLGALHVLSSPGVADFHPGVWSKGPVLLLSSSTFMAHITRQ